MLARSRARDLSPSQLLPRGVNLGILPGGQGSASALVKKRSLLESGERRPSQRSCAGSSFPGRQVHIKSVGPVSTRERVSFIGD